MCFLVFFRLLKSQASRHEQSGMSLPLPSSVREKECNDAKQRSQPLLLLLT
jgi:hypothetical protein